MTVHERFLVNLHGSALTATARTVEALRAIIELQNQAPSDLCGDQREFMLPRINTLFMFMLATFPRNVAEAMEDAVDGWGKPLVDSLAPTEAQTREQER